MEEMGTVVEGKMTVAAIAAAVTFSLVGSTTSLWLASNDGRSIVNPVFNAAVVAAFTIVGAVVAAARPANRVGWAMLVGGVLWALGGGSVDLAYHGIIAAPGRVPGAAAFAICGSIMRALSWYAITLVVPAVFPDSRLTESRWLSRLLVAIVIGAVLGPVTDSRADLTNMGAWRNPIAPGPPWDILSGVAFLAQIPSSLVATVWVLALLVSRWRHGDRLRRQQITLFAAAAGLSVVAVPIAFAFDAGGWIFGAAAVPLPFAIGFAVLARGLYDLRTAVNRTLVWLTLSAVVAGTYALVIAGGANLLHVDRDVTWLAWAAAAVVAVSFAPLRDGLQRTINRVTFGRWNEPYDVLASLGQRLEATADIDRLLAEVTTELESLGLHDVTVCDDQGQIVAGPGPKADHEVVLSIAAYGQPVGTLAYRPPPTPLRPRDRRLLDDLAGHLGGVLHARTLTSDLQKARERLVVAGEEERRRLRRDLHDGLGPALAGHLLRLDVIAGKVGLDGPAAAEVNGLRDEVRSTVLEVRRVVEGLRPPSLDELGLAGAVSQATRRLTGGSGLTLDIRIADLPKLPAAVEVAAYRIVTEAVTNVVRHAAATTCRIDVEAHDAFLRLAVSDNGRGIGQQKSRTGGNGLQTMRERTEELRGRLQLTSGEGTTVSAELPLTAGRSLDTAATAPNGAGHG